MQTKLLAFTCLALAAFIAATAFLQWRSQGTSQGVVISSGEALVGGDFEVTDHLGRRVTQADFRGKPTLYFFGYTFCPDVCPAELQVISAALNELGNAGNRFNVAFVTIDPERDTPEVMREYVSHFRPGIAGLTGSAEDIRKMASAFRVYYRKVEQDGSDDYLMDHSSFVYLMDADGKFVRHFTYGTSVDDLANGLREALNL